GRVWFWYGDGGLAAYYGEDCCPMSVLSMLSVLGYLPVFNIAENALRPENDIKLRIGMHYGTAVYKNDVNKMTSQDMKFAQDLEKHAADPNSIALSEAMYRMLPDQVRRSFYPDSDLQGSRVYKYTMR
ncbi:MAG: hypothetical protein KDK27_08485, partial [Leptospiraceae bacterium]|nr:hypothetical protein [Leptospiraceae bacterium]